MRNFQASLIIFILDFLALTSSLLIALRVSFLSTGYLLGSEGLDVYSHIFINRVYAVIFIMGAILFSIHNIGHYRRRIPWWSQVRFITIAIVIGFFVDSFMHFVLRPDFSGLWISYTWVFSYILLILGRVISRFICEKLEIWKQPTIIIGSGDNIIDTIYAINSDGYVGYDIKAIILHKGFKSFNKELLPEKYKNIKILDGREDYKDYLKKTRKFFYIIAPDLITDINIEKLSAILSENQSGYAIVPPTKGLALYGNNPQYFFGYDVMLMQPRLRIHSPFGILLKRAIDFFGAIFLVLALSPLFITIYFIIMAGGGNVFFFNKRIGKSGREFYCIKFRTMHINAEQELKKLLDKDPEKKSLWETHRKLKDDPRVTKIGKFLRKSSLDELPQLFNVIKGEMSLVGPRPILEDEISFFDKQQIEDYYSVRPGITGLWQVSGRNNTSFKQRVLLDSWYIKNWSIWYDIVILFKTFSVLVNRTGAY